MFRSWSHPLDFHTSFHLQLPSTPPLPVPSPSTSQAGRYGVDTAFPGIDSKAHAIKKLEDQNELSLVDSKPKCDPRHFISAYQRSTCVSRQLRILPACIRMANPASPNRGLHVPSGR